MPKLKNHLLLCLVGSEYDSDKTSFTARQRNAITFVQNRIYRHKVLRINYTTYDLRRVQDVLNPRTHADVMVLAHEDESEHPHPYWYARIIGIFHLNVRYEARVRRMEILWVRWLARSMDTTLIWAARRLPRVGFYDGADPSAFGFLDPEVVIRGVHLIPAFTYGRTSALLPHSLARQPSENHEDWEWFYINMYV